jgi:hypothetical protein
MGACEDCEAQYSDGGEMRGEHELQQLHECDEAVVIPIYHRKHAHNVTREIYSGMIVLTRSPSQ